MANIKDLLDTEFNKESWRDRLADYKYSSSTNTDVEQFKLSKLWEDIVNTAMGIIAENCGMRTATIWPCGLDETSDCEAITLTFAIACPPGPTYPSGFTYSKSFESTF